MAVAFKGRQALASVEYPSTHWSLVNLEVIRPDVKPGQERLRKTRSYVRNLKQIIEEARRMKAS